MQSDDLMLALQRGSGEPLEELFERYRGAIHRFFARRLAYPSRAEDLTQELFIALLQSAARYEPRSSVRTYLYGIAFNLLLAERRRQRKLADADALDPIATEGDLPDRALWVREALSKLEENDREILMLREYEQLSYQEIAALLRIPLNTVRSRLFRSRIAVKQLLEPSATETASKGIR